MGWSSLLLFACGVVYVQAHGMLMDPPNRASLYRLGYHSPKDYDDARANCGGLARQHVLNGGKCGVCGDPYDEPQPRPHELGGMYGIGYIVASYKAGQLISTNVKLSASHYGYWELRICPHPYDQEQSCFDNGYLLELQDGATKYYPRRGAGSYNVTYRLPAKLTCKHCVLQWLYTAGNNWGVCVDGTTSLECGKQEHFYSCSDISIEANVTPSTEAIHQKEMNYKEATNTTKLSSSSQSAFPRYSLKSRRHQRNSSQNF